MKKKPANREVLQIRKLLKASADFWFKEANRLVNPQGVATQASREAAAKWQVLTDVIEGIQKGEHLLDGWSEEV